MTREAAEALAKRLSIGPGGYAHWKIEFHARPPVLVNADDVAYMKAHPMKWLVECWTIGIKANGMPDRNDPTATSGFLVTLDRQKVDAAMRTEYGDRLVLNLILNELILLVVHELEESLMLDGVRVFDPHRDELEGQDVEKKLEEAT